MKPTLAGIGPKIVGPSTIKQNIFCKSATLSQKSGIYPNIILAERPQVKKSFANFHGRDMWTSVKIQTQNLPAEFIKNVLKVTTPVFIFVRNYLRKISQGRLTDK